MSAIVKSAGSHKERGQVPLSEFAGRSARRQEGSTSEARERALLPLDVDDVRRALDEASDASEILAIEIKLDAAEKYMRDSGLFTTEEIRPINETRMRARWKLGRVLAKVDRQKQQAGPGRGKAGAKTKVPDEPSFSGFLKSISLDKKAAILAQRIGALPEGELEKAFAAWHKINDLLTYADLIDRARSWWYKEARAKKHRLIYARATASMEPIGPFPLIYADPPWKFETYSEKGLERTPDQHYPTLTDEEIKNFRVAGKSVRDIAMKQAALLLWCTSSNLARALDIMTAWGFEFRTSAVWDKMKTGTGLVFLNQHELLLYGIRGGMPGPQWQPRSVWTIPRGEHSAKPPEIRTDIEKMYPDFDQRTRLELFSRDRVPGWTCYGYEADRGDAAA